MTGERDERDELGSGRNPWNLQGGGSPGVAASQASGEEPQPTQAPASEKSSSRVTDIEPGLLVEMLYQDERYPILLAGSAQAGKSTIIISLIHAAARSGRAGDTSVDVSFGYSFFDAEVEGDRSKLDNIQQYAERFFQNSASDFLVARKSLEATQESDCVVIPLDLTFRGDEEPLKIAIIDGRGEWYEPNADEKETLYRDFHPDIKDLIASYEPSMSFLWVAPVIDREHIEIAKRSDVGLTGTLSQYQRHRPARSRILDSHLYLLSKWDSESSFHTGEYFERVDGKTIVDYVDKNYRTSWDKFRGLPLGQDDADRRKFMQYCAWRFQSGKPVPLTDKQLDPFLRYPRTLLNWIVSNALKIEARRDGKLETSIKFAPFPDVMPTDTQYISISTRVIRLLTQ